MTKISENMLEIDLPSSGKYTVMEEKTKEYSTRMQLHIKDFQVKVTILTNSEAF